jgi:type IV pilus assembly protein PilW
MRARAPAAGPRRGFTLIELLVAVAIGMALTLAITVMLTRYESGRRNLTTINDAVQGGSYTAYLLDRHLRSAGSGYAQGWRNSFGCALAVARAGAVTLPRATAFPAPFAAVPQTVRLAPVVVHAGAGGGGSDVLAVITGSSGLGESPMRLLPASATSTKVNLDSTVGLRADDLVMLFQDGSNCLVQQVAAGFAGGASQQLDFGGTYAADEVGGVRLDAMGTVDTAWAAVLGNTTANRPQFQLIGVGDNASLMAYDMLRLDGTDTPQALADGVADLRAVYGVDSDSDGRVDSWQSPATAPWDAASLLDGSATARVNLSRIVAVRVGLLVRTSVPERDAVSPTQLTLFPDLGAGLTYTRTLAADEQQLRWRVLDFTVPLRNVLLMPRS